MSKAMKVFSAIGLGLVLVVSIMGCGQQTPSINTSTNQPNGLAIKGVVYDTTLNGTVGAPLVGAVVTLSGDSLNQTSTTNSRGEYLFSNIPDGVYILIVTADGHSRNSTTSVTIKPSSAIPADNTITVADILLGSRPIILSFSPVPDSVVSQTPTFVVAFNEAMDTSTVIPSLFANGVRSFALSGNTVPLLTSWSADNKTITITPEASLVSNETYWFNVDYNSVAKDIAGYPLSTGNEQALASGQYYRVATGGVPGAPSNVTLVVGTKIITSDAATGADYADIMSGATFGIHWDPSSGNVSGYKVYVAKSADGIYTYLADPTGNQNYLDTNANSVKNALYGSSSINPVTTGGFPMINTPLFIKVVAYNGDGESAPAATGGIKELVPPTLSATAWDGNGTFTNNYVLDNNYYLPAIGTDNTKAYIFVSEPVDPSTVVADNFEINVTGIIAPARTITGIRLLSQSSSGLRFLGPAPLDTAYVVIEITADGAITPVGGDFYRINAKEGGLKDLAGNAVATGGSTTGNLP